MDPAVPHSYYATYIVFQGFLWLLWLFHVDYFGIITELVRSTCFFIYSFNFIEKCLVAWSRKLIIFVTYNEQCGAFPLMVRPKFSFCFIEIRVTFLFVRLSFPIISVSSINSLCSNCAHI